MKKIERRFNAGAEVKLESRAEGQPQVITGMGAVCYDGTADTEYVLWDFDSERCVERILPGAFDLALSRPDDVRGLFNHDPNELLGRTTSGTMKLTANAKGLAYEITPGNTTTAANVKEHLSRKDVTGSSITFMVDEERWTQEKNADGKWNVLREIIAVALADTGPVTYPAYEKTTAGLRTSGEPDEAKAALKEFRAKQQAADVSVKGKSAAYAARARAIEIEQLEHRDAIEQKCPECGAMVLPDADGNCPDCGEPLDDSGDY